MASKMYILMKRELSIPNEEMSRQCGEPCNTMQLIDDGHVALGACHGTLMCYLKYKDTPGMQEWLTNSFRKCLCVVNENEWWQARGFAYDKVIVTESAFGGAEIGMVFAPREEFPKCFKYFRLFRGKGDIDIPVPKDKGILKGGFEGEPKPSLQEIAEGKVQEKKPDDNKGCVEAAP